MGKGDQLVNPFPPFLLSEKDLAQAEGARASPATTGPMLEAHIVTKLFQIRKCSLGLIEYHYITKNFYVNKEEWGMSCKMGRRK